MSTQAHDNLCDTGEKCLMCRETDEGPCCTECAFEDCWEQAPALVKRLVERNDAEYFWLRGQQAGRVAEQVELRKWLVQMMEGYDERVSR